MGIFETIALLFGGGALSAVAGFLSTQRAHPCKVDESPYSLAFSICLVGFITFGLSGTIHYRSSGEDMLWDMGNWDRIVFPVLDADKVTLVEAVAGNQQENARASWVSSVIDPHGWASVTWHPTRTARTCPAAPGTAEEHVVARFGPASPGVVTLLGRASRGEQRYLVSLSLEQDGSVPACAERFLVAPRELATLKRVAKFEGRMLGRLPRPDPPYTAVRNASHGDGEPPASDDAERDSVAPVGRASLVRVPERVAESPGAEKTFVAASLPDVP